MRLCKSLISFKSMLKAIQGQKEGVLVDSCSLEVKNWKEEKVPREIHRLLREFEDFFVSLTELCITEKTIIELY